MEEEIISGSENNKLLCSFPSVLWTPLPLWSLNILWSLALELKHAVTWNLNATLSLPHPIYLYDGLDINQHPG